MIKIITYNGTDINVEDEKINAFDDLITYIKYELGLSSLYQILNETGQDVIDDSTITPNVRIIMKEEMKEEKEIKNETVTIYGKDVIRYKMDSPKSFQERVASVFDTIPRWVLIYPAIILVKEMGKYKTFTDFINNIDKSKFKLEDNELLLYWFSNIKKANNRLENSVVKAMIKVELEKEGIKNPEKIIEILFDTNFEKSIENEVKRNKKRVEMFDKTIKTLDSLEVVSYQPFQKQESVMTITVNCDYHSIETFFSHITCSMYVPIVLCSSGGITYKQYNGCELPEHWKSPDNYYIKSPVSIVARIYNKERTKKLDIIQPEDYVTCNITLDTDEKKMVIVYFYDNMTKVSSSELTKRLYECVDLKIPNHLISVEDDIKGNYIIPCKSFHSIIMSDMIMNDTVFSSFMAVDESNYASKTRGGLTIRLFIKEEEIRCTMTSSIRDKQTDDHKYVKTIPFDILPDKGRFIRLYIKHVNRIELLPVIVEIFCKLLSYYNERKKTVFEEYKKYDCVLTDLPTPDCKTNNITDIKQTDIKRITNYARQCGVKRIPALISANVSEGDAIDVRNNSREMTFPAFTKPARNLIKDVQSHTFTCENNTETPYIGVQPNKDNATKETYPYVPCCFKSPQVDKAGGLRDYLAGILPEDVEKTDQQNIITKRKFIGTGKDDRGVLPDNLTRLLQSCEKDHIKNTITYLRQGTFDTPYSFLECVMTAVSGKKQTLEDVNQKYNELLNGDITVFTAATQENPGESLADIKNSFTNYLDPRKWCSLFEHIFNCKIVIFSRDEDKTETELTFPYHRLEYLQYAHENPAARTIVCVYEHYGTLNPIYPKCEPIVFVKKTDESKRWYLFGADTSIFEYQQKALLQTYYLPDSKDFIPIQEFVLPFEIKNIKSQFIDSYGKMRAIRITHESGEFTVLTTPLPPLVKPIMKENERYEQSTINIDSFMKKYDLSVYSVYVHDGNTKEITFSSKSQTTKYTIKCNQVVEFEKVKIDETERYPENPVHTTNILNTYIKERRLAFIIVEYFIYFYSHYFANLKSSTDLKNVGILTKFMTFVIVENDIVYNIPDSPIISLKQLSDCNFIKDGKFIVSNNDTRRRLLYALRQRLTTHYEMVRDYHSRPETYNFYTDQYYYNNVNVKNTIVTTNLNAFEQIDNQVHDRVILSNKFFIQPFNDIKIPSLLVKSENKEDAKRISSLWRDHNSIKVKDDVKDVKNTALYLYNSKLDIKKMGQGQDDSILVYKKDDILNYLAICKL